MCFTFQRVESEAKVIAKAEKSKQGGEKPRPQPLAEGIRE
jgi:hypothetical protein